MDQPATFKPFDEHRRIYDLIWSQMPHMQKRTSSTWWFFILFPKEGEGHGPRQMMFSTATRVAQNMRICGVWQPGMALTRPQVEGVEQFPAMTVGWYCDGREVHEDFVKATAVTTLSTPGQRMCSFNDQGQGMEIKAAAERPLTLETRLSGQKGSAHFFAWGDLDCLHSSPHESINLDTPLGGVHFIAWRRMNFQGEFDLPTGRETLAGSGYFQRVCLNVPTFPWKWIWALFPDGSMFSAYVPYVGFNLFRRGYHFFADERHEQTAVPIRPTAFWDWVGPGDEIRFDQVSITPCLAHPHPQFDVQVRNRQGDFLTFRAATYGHANLDIDRPLLGGWLRSHWNYNEYMFRMEGLNGRIGGQPITNATMGQGFGSLEYAWGLGL